MGHPKKKIRFAITSDLHGSLPQMPDADAYLLCGDYCPNRNHAYWFYKDRLKPWVDALAERAPVFAVAGNHDELFEQNPEMIRSIGFHWTYLEDSAATFRGLKLYGSPWQPRFYDWAYNLDEPELARKWEMIPGDTDVLLLHGPPNGVGDKTDHQERIGSPSLRRRIEAVRPRLVCYGHNHGGYGRYTLGRTVCVNAALMDERYEAVNPPVVVEIPE